MEQKFNEIVLLVHPLYDLLCLKIRIHEHIRENPEITPEEIREIIRKKLKNAKIKHNYNQTLKEYKEQIQKYKNKPNTLVILYFSTINYGMHKVAIDYLIQDFVTFCNKTLKGRFIISYRRNTADLLLDLPIKKLSNHIKLFSFGEYRDVCVTDWLNKMTTRLEETNHSTRSKILKNKCIVGKSNKKGLDFNVNFRKVKRRR